MKKDSKNLGKNMPCPWCKNTFSVEINGVGSLVMKQKCPHCQRKVRFIMFQKTVITLEKILEEVSNNAIPIVILIIGALIGFFTFSEKPHVYVDDIFEIFTHVIGE